MIDFSKIDLPIVDSISDIRTSLNSHNTLILNAPPGAGKSTILPLALMEEIWLAGKKIIMLEPRRLAAKSIALRMAQLLNEPVGERVGYRIRFESVVSDKTVIEIVTEGILTRMLQSDNSLSSVGLVVFDEFHERSLYSDLALALCRDAQQILRPDLKMLIMSATLDANALSGMLQAPVITTEGRQYPVEIIYTGEQDMMMIPDFTARTILRAIKEQEGDILAFLPGEGEILRCVELLKPAIGNVLLHPLYGSLPMNEQIRAIMPNKQGRRKVVLATSIAETSLTIEGVKVVVDCGYGRTLKFNPATSLSSLETIEITKDSATQRAGRAGRLAPGVCYRIWSSATQHRMAEHRVPEIAETDLTSLVLTLAHWGVNDIESLTWLTQPPKSAVSFAYETLDHINAIEDKRITAHGKLIENIPCHPRIAHMLLLAKESGMLSLATDLAALLDERDPLNRDSGIDINLRIDALRRNREQKLNNRQLNRIEQIALQYRRIFKIELSNESHDSYETGILLVHAFPERIASARPGNNAQFQLSNGAIAMASHKDSLAHLPWLAVASMDARQGMGKIFLASPLNPKDLLPYVKQVDRVEWDTRKGGVVAVSELRIGSLILQSKPLKSVDQTQIAEALCNVIKKEGAQLLNFTPDVTNWQNRVLSLRKWCADENWPNVTTENLLQTNADWLSPYLSIIKKTEQLAQLDLFSILKNSLTYEQQQRLKQLTPETIEVPSGSNIKIQYSPIGELPIMEVRLQELFGLLETPRVNDDEVHVVMHLLSPGYKLVQITSDLRSFWNSAYFDVRKDLRSRYPKHSWPEEPLKAKAVKGVKRRETN